ncbi:helix-turn-helix domain-containing protein [Microbacterium imperiale]|uniref:Helix-turn-helix domain-containing protein n=1 Tax=Microbacterium imperiale TaxID=33884 RepID=A0A9W6M2N5_9MICO|nr:hypothetical protein [Microbacterium imperiale]MDS0198619.1 helix-turn-helix domain-containing protein [Microbacterium imperiale]BFE39855.1 hypothetical protein GCM10017544_08110 [Microbacterium imperiale]GLJ79170.1 hypothetical protein GCM10017586_08520 [Microbacterium imperiale]
MTETRDGFARIPDWLTRHAVPALGLTAAEGFVYVAVRSRADADGLAWPSYPTIAHETGTSESTAARAVKRLVQVGLLEVAEPGRQHQATVYRVVERPSLPPKPDRPLSKSERRRAQAPHRGEPEAESPEGQAPHGDAQAPHGGVLRLLTVGSEVDTVKNTQEVDTSTPTALRAAPPQRGDGADDVNADGQARLSALLPAFSVPDEQRRQPPPTSRARASAHRHVFDPVSGYCGCGLRNDREEGAR